MDDAEIPREPNAVRRIVDDTQAMGFNMISEPKVGALLATLSASKPAGPRTTEDVWGINARCLEGVDLSPIPTEQIYGSRLD
jgi:hypothetical protein